MPTNRSVVCSDCAIVIQALEDNFHLGFVVTVAGEVFVSASKKPSAQTRETLSSVVLQKLDCMRCCVQAIKVDGFTIRRRRHD